MACVHGIEDVRVRGRHERKGTVHVRLGDQQRDLHAGGTVFIPAYTWVSVKNAGAETVRVAFVFSGLGLRITCAAILCCQTNK